VRDTDRCSAATAVALGASAGLNDMAAQAVKDAYAGLKRLLTRRRVDVAVVERKPKSADIQDLLRADLEQLTGTPDAVDEELLAAARELVAAVEAEQPEAGTAIGIDLKKFQVAALRVSGVIADGTGVRGEDWKITGDAVFENIRAGRSATDLAVSGEAGDSGPPS
jgi:hypothetical protein